MSKGKGERDLVKRIISALILVLLSTAMLTFAFDVKQVKPELLALSNGPAEFSRIRDSVTANMPGTFYASGGYWSDPTVRSFFQNGLDTRLMDVFQPYFEADASHGLGKELGLGGFAHVDNNSAELVIGLEDTRPDSYDRLSGLITRDGGKLVSTVSMDGKVAAVVVDVPWEEMSNFVSEVETARLSRYTEPNVRFKVDFTPNDPYWLKQWGPMKIEADYAWNITIGNPSVLVAVVDTGVDWGHPDLSANYVPLGYDWVNNDPDPMDDNGHGTHVVGTIAAVIHNSIGIAGLAQVRIMAEKVLDASGSGTSSDIARGIIHAVDRGAKIINLSLGSSVGSELLHEAVKYAYDHGVLVVAAAGNDATSAKHYPAAYNEVVAVSAVDELDHLAAFSNYGDWVDVAAPGVNIYSTVPDDSYAYMSGTSMASPHVVGEAALIWSRFPNMTRDQVQAQLQYSADDLGEPGFDVCYGFGRINARKAVEEAPANHDVLVLNLEIPSGVILGEAAVINATVLNMGISNEGNITVQLLVNSSIISSAMIDFLSSGQSITVNFSWTATVEGVCNVTSYIMPVTGETIVGNNALSKQMEARLPRVIKVPSDYNTIQGAIDAANEEDTVLVAPGTYYENVWISKESLKLVGEDRSNTIIDGGKKDNVILVTADNVKIDGFTIQHSGQSTVGIWILGFKGSTVSNTMILGNFLGIFLDSSAAVTLRNDTMINNVYNFGVDGDSVMDFVHDIDASNTINGKPLYYWINEHDKQVPFDAGYVAIVNSTNIVVKDLNITKNLEAVLFAYTVNSSIENVNASDNYFGIYLAYSNNNTAHNNAPMNSYTGIYLYESERNNVNDNMLINNANGMDLYYSKDNRIDFSKLLNNDFGLFLEESDDNTVSRNIALNNTYGINVQKSGYNVFRDNDMTTNEYNLGVTGNCLSHFVQDIDISNTVDGKPIYYWINQKDKEIPADAGYVAVVNSTNIVVRDLNLTNNVHGVLFAFAAESLIENVNVANNTYGIYLYGSCNNTVVYSTVTSKGERGVELINSSDNTVSSNTFTSNYVGIGLWLSAENNTINGNVVLNGAAGGVGLYLDHSSNNAIGSNVIANNNQGILLYESSINTLRNNQMTSNSYNFGVYGTSLSPYVTDVDNSNTVNGRPIYYWINQHDRQVPTNAGYVAVVNSTGVIAKNLDLSKNEQGILFLYTTNSTIMNVNASDNSNGIYLWSCDGNIMSGNSLANNFYDGIGLYYSDSNTIGGNTVSGCDVGIDVVTSNNNTISSNTVFENFAGIYLYDYSDDNIVNDNNVNGAPYGLFGIALTQSIENFISRNAVSDNTFWVGAGIYLEWSSNDNTIIQNTITGNDYGISIGYWGLYGLKDQNNNNTIYYNNLIENRKQAINLNSVNVWDNGYPSGGNYWSDYTGVDLCSGFYQNETRGDGIGDTPYTIGANNRDRFPYMIKIKGPFIPGDLNHDGVVDGSDIALAAWSFGSYGPNYLYPGSPPHPRWRSSVDINSDNVVDGSDLTLTARKFGWSPG
jgi:parallel beta-helix repeat protein